MHHGRSQRGPVPAGHRVVALHGLSSSCTDPAECARRKTYSYDSGVGILYWKNRYRGSVADVNLRKIKEGHCSEISSKSYVEGPEHTTARRNLAWELDRNYSLDEVAQRLGIASLLD